MIAFIYEMYEAFENEIDVNGRLSQEAERKWRVKWGLKKFPFIFSQKEHP